MKKYIILEAICVPVLILALFIPTFMQGIATSVRITTIAQTQYSEDIFVSGYVEEALKKEVNVDLPIVPSKVNFKLGDYVQANDIIAEVDTLATQKAIFDMAEMTQMIPQEYMEVLGQLRLSEEVVESYIPTTITAPASGTISSILLVEGAISTPRTAVATIIQADDLRVRMSVNEADVDKVKVGDKVVFKASATDDTKYSGKIERIFPTANKTFVGTSQVTVVGVYVMLDQKFDRLRPGYTVNGVIKQPLQSNVNILPYEAVQQDENNQEYVYLVNGSRAQRCYVKTGRELDYGIEIISPQLQGQKIVINAGDIKKNQSLVHIVTN